MSDLISRQQAIDAVNGLIDRFEQILRDIREANGDDSVCGMCEYDGAYIGQSGDWCNECPGFDKEDCFKLSDKCRKRWLKSVELPPAEVGTDCSEFPNNSDTISRQDAVSRRRLLSDLKELITAWEKYPVMAEQIKGVEVAIGYVELIPSAQPEIIRCAECKWFQCNMRQDGYLPKGVDEFECRHWCGPCDPTDFCSYAERRTNG